MRSCVAVAAAVFVVYAAQGCATQARQPKLNNAMLAPETVYPGYEGALLTVELRDPDGIVDRIDWVVEGYEDQVFTLNDEGERGDAAAGDGVWSMRVDVPFNTPKGAYRVTLRAYDSEGRPIIVRGPDDGRVPLTTSLTAVVEYPPEQ